MNTQTSKVRVAAISVVSNTMLVIMKIVVGSLIGSVSIISEAIHSGVDLLAAAIALFSVKTSSPPADKDHPFGHGKIENISGTIEALLIFAAAIWIITEAVQRLLNPKPIEALGWGVGVMLFSAVVNIIVSKMLFKVGRETESIALQADAWHLRTDVYTSAGVMGSLALIWFSQWAFPGGDFNWLDPLAAIATAVFILKAAYDLTVQSVKDLLDVHLPKAEEDWIRRCILENKTVIHGVHDLRTRKAGSFRFVEFHMQVDSNMTVVDSHTIAETLSFKIKQQLRSATVTIHIEPCDKSCPDKCVAGCLILEQKRQEE